MPSVREIDRTTGVSSTTVVTLSMKADTTAVTSESAMSRRTGFPRESCAERTPSQRKKPVWRRAPAMTIMPANRKMTFQSTAPKASSWSMIPIATSESPASSAMSVRSKRSVAMSA